MDTQTRSTSAVFQVYLRLRPPPPNHSTSTTTVPERFLSVESPVTIPSIENDDRKDESNPEPSIAGPTHITLNPPNDNRRRAVEKFAFTHVFEEHASQLDVFQGTGMQSLVEGVLGPHGNEGRDGLLATLGVTGSGKSHTILGNRSQRGLTQLALDILFRSISSNLLDPSSTMSLHATIAASDPSEAQVLSAQGFFDIMNGESGTASRGTSRAATPLRVCSPSRFRTPLHPTSLLLYPQLPEVLGPSGSPKSIRFVWESSPMQQRHAQPVAGKIGTRIRTYMTPTISAQKRSLQKTEAKSSQKGESMLAPMPTPRRNLIQQQQTQRPSVLPQLPDISNVTVSCDPSAEYAIVISMYEVYNDRIFDLLTPASRSASTKDFRRRPLLFKSTEASPDRKVVAGLRKVICANVREALMVLEAGLHERRVAGTGMNSVSSRSHGFFCVEVKKRRRGRGMTANGGWAGSALTIVDLAGSERARDAKTQGATLAEAGKINESLMYLGQCLQMQSDAGNNTKPNLVPFRQCKLTELLFSNSFPSSSSTTTGTSTSHNQQITNHQHHRNPQKAIMIVTADPLGDFNATSQILRYSALAREITVPRIPSITSTILAASTMSISSSSQFNPRAGGRVSPIGSSATTTTATDRETMEIAALEIARLSEEADSLRSEVAASEEARLELEAHLLSTQERMIELEAEIRDECWREMEARMQLDLARWKATWEAERDRADAHMDRKLEIFTQGIGYDEEDKENVDFQNLLHTEHVSLEAENERLRREVAQLRREVTGGKSPSKSKSKRSVLGEVKTFALEEEMGKLRLGGGSDASSISVVVDEEGERLSSASASSAATITVSKMGGGSSPTKKVRKFTARKWDLMGEEEMEMF